MFRFYDRKQLYNLVWIKPLHKIAKNFNITPIELKDVCKKLEIPTPQIGHWSKIAFKKEVIIDPLLPFRNYKIGIEYIPKIIKKKKELNIDISIKKHLSKPHPLIKEAIDKLKKAYVDDYGMKNISEVSLNIRVSPKQEKRALRIFDSIIKWFESRNYIIENRSQYTNIIIDNIKVNIALEERSTCTGKIQSGTWGGKPYYKKVYTPTEKLTLMIKSYSWDNRRKNWSDSKNKVLENQIKDFIQGVFDFVEAEKLRILEREEKQKRWDVEKKKKLYKEKCEKLEKELLDNLEIQATNWDKYKKLKSYIKEVEEVAKKEYPNSKYPEQLENWFIWVEEYLKDLNPLDKVLPKYTPAEELLNISDI